MKAYEIDYVVAAVLVEVELDARGDASKLSAQGYRDLIEQIRRTGEWPRQAWSSGAESKLHLKTAAKAP